MEFRVLGPLAVHTDRRLELGGAQQRRLLAALLVARGRIVSTHRLADVLWGEDATGAVLGRLRSAVFRLRGTLPDDHDARRGPHGRLETHPSGYRLRIDDGELDAARFEALLAEARGAAATEAVRLLETALSLWRGAAYGDLADETWIRDEAARLEELRRVASEERFQALLDAGRPEEVVGELEAFVERHPWRERARGQLMLARYRCGRQADAVAGYRSFRARLAGELGLEPSAPLRSLHRRLLEQDPDLAAAPPPASGRVGDETTGPSALGRIVGRGAEAAALRRQLAQHRVITVVGPGGVGKTRLVQHVVRQDAPPRGRPDDVHWCDLAPVADPAAVAHAVASSVGAPARPGTAPLEAIVGQLSAGRGRVVMDNCEHVRAAAAELVEELVSHCPRVVVVATSRARLGVPGEVLFPLDPLPAPPPDASGDTVGASPAVELFLERARAVHPGLEGTASELELIGELCRRLDGLPLALELAAARLRSLGLADLVDRLAERFRVLTDARSSRPARHRALREVVDWSYRLLGEPERRLFDRLSVFAGGFRLDDAESVCAGGPIGRTDVLDLVDELVDASMVTLDRGEGAAAYRLLDTLRAYGRRRLAERGEVDRLRDRHARHYRAVVDVQAERLLGAEEAAAVALLDRMEPEIREAYQVGLATGDTDLTVGLVAALFRYALWRLRDEILRWADEALAVPDAREHPRFPVLCGMASAWHGLLGDHRGAVELAQRGIDAAGPDDPRARCPLEALMHVSMWEGRIDDCLRQCDHAAALAVDPREFVADEVRVEALAYAGRREEACELAAQLTASVDTVGNPTAMASARYAWGEALSETDPAAAIPLVERAVTLADSVDNRLVAGVARTTLTSLQARHGDPEDALRSFAALIDELERVGDRTHLWTALRSLVQLLVRVEAHEDAAAVLGAVLHAPGAAPAYGADAERLRSLRAALVQTLGEEAVRRALVTARAATHDELVASALRAIEENLA